MIAINAAALFIQFKSVPVETIAVIILRYLSDPALYSSSGEWGVWEAVNRWINSPPDFKTSRTEFLPQLIKCVSLKRLNLSDIKIIALSDIVRSNPLVSLFTLAELAQFVNAQRELHLQVSAALSNIIKELLAKESEDCDTNETEAATESSDIDKCSATEGRFYCLRPFLCPTLKLEMSYQGLKNS